MDATGNVTDWATGTGVGYGYMIFYSDNTMGGFAGYRWSVNSSSVYSAEQRWMPVGRVFLG
ncbi:hypothetical protein [Streptomyces sp. NBC_00503]|uniref:hypothetical protein n=1 Tax=Streptomyces sp. NBC_00503 TaxID=2903659 RepID=UPI002E816F22|nr:hypothetical protein [Streptomyces sp. NBC_00503]WUD79269.1 hypothetical protein OG490_01025 [Streptomyces sp. NBC_00503]